nr:MAG TPA: hypothetical protein [Caudoviricetes sp.]
MAKSVFFIAIILPSTIITLILRKVKDKIRKLKFSIDLRKLK